ncbi:hypothetical protein BDV35DRAFT_375036, partial [Aspergillus flavus]
MYCTVLQIWRPSLKSAAKKGSKRLRNIRPVFWLVQFGVCQTTRYWAVEEM